MVAFEHNPAVQGAVARQVVRQSDLTAARGDAGDEGDPLDRIIGSEPSPEFAAMVAEEYRRRLEALGLGSPPCPPVWPR